MNINNIYIQDISALYDNILNINILRADMLDPVVSGNKWFKLQFYVRDAIAAGKTTLATLGGPYSNHIIATAKYGATMGLKTVGFIRGEKPTTLSPTLTDAIQNGMTLHFVSREDFEQTEKIIAHNQDPNWAWIPEGGYGITGAEGAKSMLTIKDTSSYDAIICAVGTGTMMAGLIKAAAPHQKVIGISVLKNNFSIDTEIKALLNTEEVNKSFEMIHDYHFGGYAKYKPPLIDFMNDCYKKMELPLDFVYTAKLMYGAKDLATKGKFGPSSKILVIHSGGLQGNRSFKKGTLTF
ncbi:MAG: pyridoxal-phosphate dependent enzyme [Sediminibacterium sp.]|nr:pyridoxal-phosphate dependent enzyme [Sediminibacterium sp.]